MNYYFIDYENTQAFDLDRIVGQPVKVFLFIGATQRNRLPFDLVEKIHKHAGQVQLVASSGNGKNALDFLVAYQIGRITAEDASAFIHIISKDKGFEPLVVYLKENDITARRRDGLPLAASKAISKSVITKPPGKTPSNIVTKEGVTPAVMTDYLSMSLAQKRDHIIKRLSHSAQARPARHKTLTTFVHAAFGKKLAAEQIVEVIDCLKKAGKLYIDKKNMVSYKL